MNFSIVEVKPSKTLEPYIESYWSGNFNIARDKDFSQLVVPNGCIEFIIHISNDHCALNKNGELYYKSPPYTLLGVYDKTYTVKFSENVNTFGIRFFPDGFRNIFGVPTYDFNSTYEDGIDVVGTRLYDFCSRIRESENFDSRIILANDFLINQLMINQNKFDYTHHAMQLIRKNKGLIDFELLTNTIPISLRQLQREFKNNYGIKITDYIRLSRLNAINRYMLSQQISLTELAHELEFTDQSHFIREFKRYIGLPPKKFIKNKNSFILNTE